MCTNGASAFSGFPASLVFEPELGAQQAARIVGHALQPGLVGTLFFALGIARLARRFAKALVAVVIARSGPGLLRQGLLPALALLLGGLALGFRVAGLRWPLRLRVALVAPLVPRLALVRLVLGLARSGVSLSRWRRLRAGVLARIRPLVVGLAAVGRLLPVAPPAGRLRRRLLFHRRFD